MVLRFKDIFSEIVMSSRVLFINSRYSIFSNMLTDRIRDRYCKLEFEISHDTLDEFGLSTAADDADASIRTDTIDDFMELNNIPSLTPKRVCIVDYDTLNKRQKEWVERYIKAPSPLSILVVTIHDYKEANRISRNRLVRQGEKVHLISLSFPNRDKLREIISLSLKGIKLEPKAVDLFIWRLSDNYEEYQEAFERVRLSGLKSVDYKEMFDLLEGIDNYNIEDFIRLLLKPPRNPKSKPRNVYKALRSLVDEMGARAVVTKVSSALEVIQEMRMLMNNGTLAAGLRFKMSDFKASLDDSSKLKNMSDFRVLKYYRLAMMTSLRDIVAARLILKNARVNTYSDETYERMLFTLINRCTFNENRVMNDIGMKDTLEHGLYGLNIIASSEVDDYDDTASIENFEVPEEEILDFSEFDTSDEQTSRGSSNEEIYDI